MKIDYTLLHNIDVIMKLIYLEDKYFIHENNTEKIKNYLLKLGYEFEQDGFGLFMNSLLNIKNNLENIKERRFEISGDIAKRK